MMEDELEKERADGLMLWLKMRKASTYVARLIPPFYANSILSSIVDL